MRQTLRITTKSRINTQAIDSKLQDGKGSPIIMRDCGFVSPEGWFRFRACAIIINDGNVLFAKMKVKINIVINEVNNIAKYLTTD